MDVLEDDEVKGDEYQEHTRHIEICRHCKTELPHIYFFNCTVYCDCAHLMLETIDSYNKLLECVNVLQLLLSIFKEISTCINVLFY